MQSTNDQYKLERFGKYELGQRLGKGNYSKVYEAIDKEKNIRVALKIIDLSNAKDNYIKHHYKREATLLCNLKHPSIIKFYECLEGPQTFALALEVMPENLCDFVRRQGNGRVEECLARIIFQQIASAISFIHANRIVHRDVKLENILYEPLLQRAKLTGKKSYN